MLWERGVVVMMSVGVWVWREFFVRRGVEIPRCARNDMNRARNDVDRVGVLCTTLPLDAQGGIKGGLDLMFRFRRRCLAPLDSGFRRNDGGCAQNPLGLTWGCWPSLRSLR